MDNQKEVEQQKKHSRRFMVFYVVALFSIALVLILLSYLTQVRSSRQLASLSNELNQQATVAQGAQQQMEALQTKVQEQQKRLDTLNQQLADARQQLSLSETDDLTAAIRQLSDERAALELLAAAESEMAVDNIENAAALLKQLEAYGKDRLDGTAENAVFTGRTAALYVALEGRVADAQAAQ